jgi:hypothetical protein
MEVGRSLHQRQEVDALDSGGSLDRRNEPMKKGTELSTLGWRHISEVQHMPSCFDDDRSRAGLLQRGVLDDEVLTCDDVATWHGGVQERRPRLQAVLLPTDVSVRPVIIRWRADLGRTPAVCRHLRVRGHRWPSFRVRVGQRRKRTGGFCRTLGNPEYSRGFLNTLSRKRHPVISPQRRRVARNCSGTSRRLG